MPGYSVLNRIFRDSEALNRYHCSECKLLLKEPVQSSCGHRFCRSCADDILSRDAPPQCPLTDCREPFDEEDGMHVSVKAS